MLTGIGIALVTTPALTAAVNTAPRARRGQAQGVTGTLRLMGGTVGLAIMGTVVARTQRTRVAGALSAAHGDPAMLRKLSTAMVGALKSSLAAGISSALYIGGAVVLASAVAAWALLRRVAPADARPA